MQCRLRRELQHLQDRSHWQSGTEILSLEADVSLCLAHLAFRRRHAESGAFLQRLSVAREALADKIREATDENEVPWQPWHALASPRPVIFGLTSPGFATEASAASYGGGTTALWTCRRFGRPLGSDAFCFCSLPPEICVAWMPGPRSCGRRSSKRGKVRRSLWNACEPSPIPRQVQVLKAAKHVNSCDLAHKARLTCRQSCSRSG